GCPRSPVGCWPRPRPPTGLARSARPPSGCVIATCTSRHSRNRWAGEQIGKGWRVEDVLASTPKVIEGIPATRAAIELGERYGVDLPVCLQVDQVLHHGAPVKEIMARLMGREATV